MDLGLGQHDRNGNWDIYAYDLTTETEVAITTDPARQEEADLFGNHVVWQDNRAGANNYDIYMADLNIFFPGPITIPRPPGPDLPSKPGFLWPGANGP